MKSSRTRLYITLAILLGSCYVLVPTFFGFDALYEKSESAPNTLPAYVNYFPKKGINLGLDLRGGIYLEMEVVQDEAIKNRSDLLTSEIERNTQSESFKPMTAIRAANASEITFTFKDAAARDAFGKYLNSNYGQTLVEHRDRRTDTSLTADLNDSTKNYVKEQAVKQALETVRNRIDRYGVAEPTIIRAGTNRIAIELPGAKDPERAINLIKRSGKLEFKMVDESVTSNVVAQKVQEARQSLGLDEKFTEDQVTKINTALAGKIPEGDEVLFEIQYDPVTKKMVGGVPYLLKAKSELTGDMLRAAQVNIHNNEPYVSLSFNSLGTKLFAELTKANIGKKLAIILDGNVSKAPVIQSEIPSGEAQITLGFGDYQSILREAEDLSLVLREGALPASLKELTKNIIGPTLGQDSINRGVRSSLAAAALIIIFMILYYHLSGLLADFALIVNILLTLAALAIFGATLTLPGITGIVLTIGMAVDSNILIFERIREELRAGKSPRSALEAGYFNATRAIIDSHVTTILSGIVLYQFGTGPIRGFAVTLIIGALTNLFTAIYLTRWMQDYILQKVNRERISV